LVTTDPVPGVAVTVYPVVGGSDTACVNVPPTVASPTVNGLTNTGAAGTTPTAGTVTADVDNGNAVNGLACCGVTVTTYEPEANPVCVNADTVAPALNGDPVIPVPPTVIAT
jgi:hypothetical protein